MLIFAGKSTLGKMIQRVIPAKEELPKIRITCCPQSLRYKACDFCKLFNSWEKLNNGIMSI